MDPDPWFWWLFPFSQRCIKAPEFPLLHAFPFHRQIQRWMPTATAWRRILWKRWERGKTPFKSLRKRFFPGFGMEKNPLGAGCGIKGRFSPGCDSLPSSTGNSHSAFPFSLAEAGNLQRRQGICSRGNSSSGTSLGSGAQLLRSRDKAGKASGHVLHPENPACLLSLLPTFPTIPSFICGALVSKVVRSSSASKGRMDPR